MRVIVCGGRDFDDREYLFKKLTKLNLEYKFDTIIEGGAKGADTLAREWAKENNIPYHTIYADWNKYGSKAGILRNIAMLDLEPDLVIAFAGGRGTDHMVRIASQKSVTVYRFNP